MTSQTTQLVTVGLSGIIGGYFLHEWLKQTPVLKKKTVGSRAPQKTATTGATTGASNAASSASNAASSASISSDSATATSTESEDDSEYEDEVEIDSTPLNEIPGEVRMTLVVRQDLKMGKGKAAAQCSHATLALYKKMATPSSQAYNPEMLRRWEYGNGQAKITLQAPNMEEMDVLFAQAMSLGVNAYIVHDAGRTQIAAGSATVLGLGPAPKAVLDQITGGLKLY